MLTSRLSTWQSILAAVKRASPGDTIEVSPGRYSETGYIDRDNIALRGDIQNGEWPMLDGTGELKDAILEAGDGVTVENFLMENDTTTQPVSRPC